MNADLKSSSNDQVLHMIDIECNDVVVIKINIIKPPVGIKHTKFTTFPTYFSSDIPNNATYNNIRDLDNRRHL